MTDTSDWIAEARRLCDEATPGDRAPLEANAAFFAAARTLLPRALAEVERLRADIATLEGNVRGAIFDAGCNEERATAAEAERDALRAMVVKMREALDHLMGWISKAHADDGWNSMTTPDAVVSGLVALSLTPADLSGCVVVKRDVFKTLQRLAREHCKYSCNSTLCDIEGCEVDRAALTGGDDAG